MKTRSKALLLALCAVMLVAASVLGTLAYLTDSKVVTNTFTVGQVKINLTEPNAPADKKYHLLPGGTYKKDPTVDVAAGSEDAYLRMIVVANFETALTDTELAQNLDGIFADYNAADWPRCSKTVSNDNKTITYEFRYKEVVSADEDVPPLFTALKVPTVWNNDDIDALNNMTIEITAHAIQAEGFDVYNNADAAWAAFDEQHP